MNTFVNQDTWHTFRFKHMSTHYKTQASLGYFTAAMTTVQIPGTLDFPVNYLVIKATPLPFYRFCLDCLLNFSRNLFSLSNCLIFVVPYLLYELNSLWFPSPFKQ